VLGDGAPGTSGSRRFDLPASAGSKLLQLHQHRERALELAVEVGLAAVEVLQPLRVEGQASCARTSSAWRRAELLIAEPAGTALRSRRRYLARRPQAGRVVGRHLCRNQPEITVPELSQRLFYYLKGEEIR
jgi:hypothetical protein